MAGPTKKEYQDLLTKAPGGAGSAPWSKPAMADRSKKQDTSVRPSRRPITSEGIHCDKLDEAQPNFTLRIKAQAPCEKVIHNENNSWIVLGRDRHRDKFHNENDLHYGGRGDSQCGMIDLVVGRLGKDVRERDFQKKRIPAHPDFISDSARIYISQKADIDRYFNLGSGRNYDIDSPLSYLPSIAKSAIGIKADAIRIIGREGVKIISSMDPDNSHGYMKKSIFGVELICAAADKSPDAIPTPIAKADKVAAALTRVVDLLSQLNGIVDSFLLTQMEFNAKVGVHTHLSPFFGSPTSPSITLVPDSVQCLIKMLVKQKASLLAHKTVLGGYDAHWCTEMGAGWFGSKYHKCN